MGELLDFDPFRIAIVLVILQPFENRLEGKLEQQVMILPLLIDVICLLLYVLCRPHILRLHIRQTLLHILIFDLQTLLLPLTYSLSQPLIYYICLVGAHC